MDATDRLGLPYLAAGQLQKHITVNEALTRLDVLVQCRVASRAAEAPPAEAEGGELHIVAEGATTGDWAGFAAGDLVRAEPGGWARESAPDGLVVLVADEGCVLIRHGGAWRLLGERLGEVQGLARLGLNTEADAANPLAARLAKALFTAPGGSDGGDLRLVLNKEGASDVASLVFQSGWEGRAEIGLVGDDDLVLKVADDAGIWREALRVDRDTARAVFAAGSGRVETVLLTEDGVWTPPAWARRVEVRVTGGGGGGASGAYGPVGAAHTGGGGGGAGGMATAVWDAADLAGGLTVAIGQGGAGGSEGSDGTDGDHTSLLVGGTIRIRALGGGGGKADGEGGFGGLGQVPANGGGEGGAEGSAEAGAERECAVGPGGGAGGGGLTAGGEAGVGAAGGAGACVGAAVSGGAGGVLSSGSDGAAADDFWPWAGGGGGGGGAVASGLGHDGGDGGAGAGGGGGGAGVTGGGAGGQGGDGCVILTVWG